MDDSLAPVRAELDRTLALWEDEFLAAMRERFGLDLPRMEPTIHSEHHRDAGKIDKGNPDQPRDERGRFEGDGAGEKPWWKPEGGWREGATTLPIASAAEHREVLQAYIDSGKTGEIGNAPIKDVPLSQVASGVQSTVVPATVERYIAELKNTGEFKEAPQALEYKGKFYLMDGTHRTEAALASGRTSLPMHVLPVGLPSIAPGGESEHHRDAGKVTKARRWRKLVNRPDLDVKVEAEDAIAEIFVSAFDRAKNQAVKEMRDWYNRTVKAAPTRASLDSALTERLTAIGDTVRPVSRRLSTVARAASKNVIAGIGATKGREDIVNQVNDRAESWAELRAAELVGKRVQDDGTIVDNPNPEWSIDQNTRDDLRDTIWQGMEDGKGVAGLAKDMESSYAFSEDRARMIARTEVSFAHNQGTKQGLDAAKAIGVEVKKEWLVGGDPCDECLDNADEGPIDLDDDFPSGDDAPPAHPNCECALAGVVGEDEEEE